MSEYVIAGGSKGIGFGIAKKLAGDGASVTVLSRTRGQLDELPSVRHIAFDVTKDSASDLDLPETIDGLAYCPGSISLGSFRSLKPETFRDDFELNVMGAVNLLQAAHRSLKKSTSGSVVLFSTVAVAQGMPLHGSIAASKGAIEGLTRTLAAEFAPAIRVNCVAPALTDTPLTERFFQDEAKAAAIAGRYPLNRTGTVDDLSAAAHFLLTDASSWVTGQTIGVDGGMSIVRK